MEYYQNLKTALGIKNINMDDIDRFLQEDLDKIGDITTESLFSDEKGEAKIVTKENCVVAGIKEAKKVFEKTGANLKALVKDGNQVKKNKTIAIVTGPVKSILIGERLVLNFICKMSGIATQTKKLSEKCRKINPNVKIAATRKTTPGFRKYEKKAVEIGEGDPHRFGLYDAVLIKDNHLAKNMSISKTIKIIKEKTKNKIIEIEIENEKDAIEAAENNVDYIMLDNFSPIDGKKVAKKIRKINPKIKIEVSGGITPKNITKYASYADRISLGYLTHSVRSIDFSLEITNFF